MSLSRDLLAPKELTAQEVRDLVNEWVAAGGVITQCPPGVALNFRSQLGDATPTPRHKRSTAGTAKRRAGNSAKKKKKS